MVEDAVDESGLCDEARYSFFELGEVVKTFELLETRERAIWLGRGVIGLGVALVISMALSFSLNRARRALARVRRALLLERRPG